MAFTASLGGNGMVKSLYGNKALIYKDIITNVGEAYNSETGVQFYLGAFVVLPLHIYFI